MGVFEDVQKEYPMFAYLWKIPSVAKVLKEAVTGPGFSPDEFQARLLKTPYFRNRSRTQREMERMRHLEPGQYKRQVGSMKEAIKANMSRMGFKTTAKERTFLANHMLARGETVDSPGFQESMRQWAIRNPGRLMSGAIKGQIRNARTMARQEYFLNPSPKELRKWGVNMAFGHRSADDMRQFMQARAMSRWSHLSNRLKSGETMESIFDGHRQVIAEQLDLDPSQVGMVSGKWASLIDKYDKDTRTHRAATLGEAQKLARQDSRFWDASTGRQLSASLANTLLERFGERK